MLLLNKGNSADPVTRIQKQQRMKRSLAHTVWECKYHIVWVPKNRRKVICGKLKREIGNIVRKLCEYKGVAVIEGTACPECKVHFSLDDDFATAILDFISN
jgi:putative transposase